MAEIKTPYGTVVGLIPDPPKEEKKKPAAKPKQPPKPKAEE